MKNINQETAQKFQLYEKQIQQIQKQMQSIDNGIQEIEILKSGLDSIKDSTGKEILAPIGRGVFIKAKILSDKLITDIGDRNLVEKDINDTKRISQEQIEKLEELRKELQDKLKEIDNELTQLILKNQQDSN
ncbi:MAG: prefoldin subunit alpha [Nanoarchaeota archaeon]